MKIQKRKGGCQCGVISYELLGPPITLYRCHCTDCQTASGSAFGMSMWVKKDDFKLTSGILKSFVRIADSNAKVESFFCGSCGVRIYAKAAVLESEHIVLKPGTLQDTDDLRPSADIWIESKQEWFELPTDTKHFQGQPLPEELIGSYEAVKLS